MKNSVLDKQGPSFLLGKISLFRQFGFLLLLLVFGVSGIRAQALLTEDFSYSTAGNITTASSSAWAAHSGSTFYPQYSTSGLSFSGHAGSSVGGSVTIATNGVADVNKTFTSQTGTVYMSCLVNFSSAAASADYFLHFNNTGTFISRVLAVSSGTNLRFGVSKAATPTGVATNFSFNTTYMLVIKYTFIAGTVNDQIDLWVLSSFASTESAAGTPLQTTTAGADATALNAISIRQGTPPAGTIDAIRVGTTWSDIAPAASSSSSNIILNSSFTHPSNIDYSTYQTASGLTSSNSIEVGKFDIQDGGGSSDADALGTKLTACSLTVANSSNIRALALFDGTTNVGEITTVGATAAFSGLTLTAADNSSKTFSVRATFKDAVTDNQQISFTLAAATADAAGSSFAAADAGAAATSTSGDNNRIEVATTAIIFDQNVSNVSQNAVMSPSPTVRAVDANTNYDLDNTSNVVMSITTGSTIFDGTATTTVAMAAGVATFNNLKFTTAANTNNLTATQGSYTVISSAFNVTASAPEINVKQSTTSLASGVGSHAAGSQISGTSGSAITFTIENLGSANLTYSSITNLNTTDFTLNLASTSSPIAASGTTTFTVAFNPTTAGAKTTTITINNNDADEGTYTFYVTGNGTVSTASNIITNVSYSYSSNIDYASFQTASTLSSVNSVGVAGLIIQDGAGAADTDNLGTTLTAITFSTGGSTAIKTAALFDGSSNVSEVAVNGATSISFSGLSLSATDASIKNFELRVTYQSTVTDNQQITFTVSAATALATNSGFATANAGAAFSSTTGDNNKLEVSATVLAFLQQPSNVALNAAMSPSPTVSANDGNGNRDLDYVTDMTATTTGTFAGGSTNTITPSNGLGTFSNLQFSALGSGLNIAASSGSLIATGNSNSFDVSSLAIGDFRSNTAAGNWNVAASWQTWNGTTWVTASAAPSSGSTSNNVTIRSGHTITITVSGVACKNLTIESTGKLFNNNAANRYIDVLGNITCDGTIGNGATADGICFNIEGATCLISGSGTFDCSRIRKNKTTNTTTNLTISMNVNARYNGTAIYNSVGNTTFNIIISSGTIVNCPGDALSNSGGSISIDGVAGADVNECGGSITVNGTLTLSGIGTSTSQLFAKTNNVTAPVTISIGGSGTINTPAIDFSASGTVGHTFSIASGGILNITNEPASFLTPSNTNNTYSFNSNSNINYNKSGDQTIYTFGSSQYQGNITLSGSGIKTVPSTGFLNIAGTLTTANLLTLKSDANGTASIGQLSAGTISGNLTVERYIPSTNGRGYKYLAAPFSAGPTIANSWQQQIYITGPGSGGTICPSLTAHTSTGFDATSNSNPSMFVFDETTATAGSNNYASTWTSVANTNATNLTAGIGYNVYVRGARSQGCGILVYPYTLTANAVTLSASGTVKTGSASLPVTYTVGNGDGWNLVGNPYPCEIDWDATSGWTKTNIDNAVYMYNPAGDNYASYSNTASPVSVNGGQRYIPSGTAFFVKANAASPSLACTEAVKTSTNATPFLKGNKPFSIHLNLSYSNGRTDESFVFLNQNLTDGFDNSYDIEKLANPSNVNIYSIDASHKQYAANAIANIADESDKILPLGIGDAYNGNYTLHLDAVDLPELHQVFLRDHYLNKVQQLPAGDSINYNFTVSNDSLSANNARFDLLIANKNKRSTGLNQLPALADVKVFPNPSKDIITVSMPASAQYVSSLVVYNVMGQMVKTIEHPKAEEQINLSELGAGMYFLSFVGNAQVLKTVKVCKN